MMHVEVKDNALVLAKVDAAIERIMARRRAEDDAYEERWRTGKTTWTLRRLFRLKPPTADDKPPHYWGEYPSYYAYGTLATMKKVKLALEHQYQGTLGTVHLDGDEVETIFG